MQMIKRIHKCIRVYHSHWFLDNSIIRVICFATWIRPNKKKNTSHPDGIVNLCGYEIPRVPRAINLCYSFSWRTTSYFQCCAMQKLKRPKKKKKKGRRNGRPLGPRWNVLFEKNYLTFPFLFVKRTTARSAKNVGTGFRWNDRRFAYHLSPSR